MKDKHDAEGLLYDHVIWKIAGHELNRPIMA